MAIKVNGTIAIQDDKQAANISKITFDDATFQTTAGVAGTLGTTLVESLYQVGNIANPNSTVNTYDTNDWFGSTIAQAINGNIRAGAPNDGPTEGAVYDISPDNGTVVSTHYESSGFKPIVKFGSSFSVAVYNFGFAILSEGFSSYAYANAGTNIDWLIYDFENDDWYDLEVTSSLTYSPSLLAVNSIDEWSAAINRRKFFIGLPRSSNSSSQEGVVFVGSLVNGGTQLKEIASPNPISTALYKGFGASIAVNDKNIFIGAPYEPEVIGNSDNAGRVYVYDHLYNHVGTLIGTLTMPLYDRYLGTAVAANERYVYVGSPTGGYDFDTQYGLVRIYDADSFQLVHTLQLPDNPSYELQSFGYNLVCNDQYLVVSARNYDSSTFPTGKIYIYNAGTFDLISSITPTEYARFGSDGDISIRGSTLAFSSYTSNSNAGRVLIHKLCAEVTIDNVDTIQSVGGTKMVPSKIAALNALV